MGSRRSIKYIYGDGSQIFFYTHWNGEKLTEVLEYALRAGKSRWNDEAYLARIIFCGMVALEGETALTGITGFGIGPKDFGDDHPTIVVDTRSKTVDGVPFAEFVF